MAASPRIIAFSSPDVTRIDWWPGVWPGVSNVEMPALIDWLPSIRSSRPAASIGSAQRAIGPASLIAGC